MAHSAPGRHTREGISLIELMEIFPSDTAAKECVRVSPLAARPCVPPLLIHGRFGHRFRQTDALALSLLPKTLQRPHGHGYGGVKDSSPQVGDCYLSLVCEPQRRFFDEAPPRSENNAKVRMVLRPPPSRSVLESRSFVRWPSRGGRDVHGWKAEEHAQE